MSTFAYRVPRAFLRKENHVRHSRVELDIFILLSFEIYYQKIELDYWSDSMSLKLIQHLQNQSLFLKQEHRGEGGAIISINFVLAGCEIRSNTQKLNGLSSDY